MKQKIIGNVLNKMEGMLNDEQLVALNNALYSELIDCDIKEKTFGVVEIENDWKIDLRDFLLQKKLEGKADSTIKQYRYQLTKLLSYLNKKTSDIVSDDILKYMMDYKRCRKNVSNRSFENMRLCFSSFFRWALSYKRTAKDVMSMVGKIKCEKLLKKPFSDEELEVLHTSATSTRDKAMIQFLYSTAVRVSEMCALNRNDIKFNDNELVIFGKGSKERVVYLNAKSSLYLREYLKERTDNNPALFVSLRKPYDRLSVSGVENILRKLGSKCGIKNVHPHRFRRTAATNALNRGMELQYVKTMLGHISTDTTMLYCNVQNANVKFAHNKFLTA